MKNEEIEKFESQKSKPREEKVEEKQKTNKRKIYFRWAITISLILVYEYLNGTFQDGYPQAIGTTFLDNLLGTVFMLLLAFWSISVLIWLIIQALISNEISFSKILMWITILFFISSISQLL